LSGAWWQLAEQLEAKGMKVPLPQACCSTTIELRGELDVSHAWAQTDAQAIVDWLRFIDVLACDQTPVPPVARCAATPLAGSETLRAPCPGIVVFAAEVGQMLQAGELVAEIIDPLANQTQRVVAGVAGVFYARIRDRYITTGGEIGKIAGAQAFRTGELLGA
jgi:predicted deacylase